MDDVLLDIVVRRLEKSPLAEQPEDLLLAALESEEDLKAQLDAQTGHLDQPVTGRVRADQLQADDAADAEPPRPVGAYLRSLTVSGFRGIGEPATLNLAPGPGLTLVVGRNGSGKSSFAEALEVLLTGHLRRWETLSAVWRQGWRSMHQTDRAEITAEFLVEGTGPAVVQRTWPAGADFAGSSVWTQYQGEKRTGLERLEWSSALADYRPFLSHSELEAFFGSPSGLYELLASVLGLKDLTLAAARLAAASKAHENALKDVTNRLPDVLGSLASSADERAGACREALGRQPWDLAAARSAAIVTGLAASESTLSRLGLLAQLALPAETGTAARTAAAALRQAATGLDEVAGSPAGRARALADLLAAALQHHKAHGDGDCPVCGQPSALTGQWRQATELELTRLNREAQAAESAERAAADTKRHAVALLQPPPEVLAEESAPGLDPALALATWQTWATIPDAATPVTAAGLRALAVHLDQALTPLKREIGALSARAAAEYSERNDRWAPVAAKVTSWCADADAALAAAAPVAAIKAADKWLKNATDDIRNERLAPLAGQARTIWGMLRQDSNVDLGAIRLAGSVTQRRVELDVRVDGTPGSALGVMSQGEVNALALSVFLPRATLPASPFRFLVIDDPVQAMDPAKVDGLARVLEKAAADRQVIVFTHDNRLAQAITQLSIRAGILEVTRRPGSVVEVRRCLDPVQQALRDAGALAADRSVPADIAARVVPGLCRTAVEAAFTAAIWRRQLRAGHGHAEIEAGLDAAGTRLTPLAALALTGDADDGSAVLPRLNAWGRRFADTYQSMNRGAHAPHTGDLGVLVRAARQLTAKISDSLI